MYGIGYRLPFDCLWGDTTLDACRPPSPPSKSFKFRFTILLHTFMTLRGPHRNLNIITLI